jgi:bifunctional oligoribonuclease and PAP phosphatase NrnA
MDQQNELITYIHDQLQNVDNILVISHQRPDGDAIGSLLGIGLALIEIGKKVNMVLSDGLPDNFKFLAGSELITAKPSGNVDYILVVDSADVRRTDPILNGCQIPDLNIDHHKTNTHFAKINLVESEAVATSEILAKYIPDFGLKITEPVANALLAGIVTDTIGFRTTNINPNVLRITANLMDLGGDLSNIYYRTIVGQTYTAARYWGAGLSKLKAENGLVWTTLSLDDRRIAGYQYRDDADLVKILSAIEGARIALILTEQAGGYVKISWRLCGSLPTDLDVSEIAQKFGGGGHKAAAGADVKGKLDEVLIEVLNDTRIFMNQYGKPVDETR